MWKDYYLFNSNSLYWISSSIIQGFLALVALILIIAFRFHEVTYKKLSEYLNRKNFRLEDNVTMPGMPDFKFKEKPTLKEIFYSGKEPLSNIFNFEYPFVNSKEEFNKCRQYFLNYEKQKKKFFTKLMIFTQSVFLLVSSSVLILILIPVFEKINYSSSVNGSLISSGINWYLFFFSIYCMAYLTILIYNLLIHITKEQI